MMSSAQSTIAMRPSAVGPSLLGAIAGGRFSDIPGLAGLWAETLGDSDVCVAVLDGPVDLSHLSLAGARLNQVESLVSSGPGPDAATEHGTHVASVIFGRHGGPVPGIAPACRGVSIPIFASVGADTFQVCSQVDLSRAIGLAVQHGAQIINVSGGELSLSGSAYPLLADTVRQCAQAGVLIVAAAGNQGCDCVHMPAGIESVLAVGGMGADGLPLEFSNWGSLYQAQGVLAPAVEIPGAFPGGGIVRRTGTSYATPVVAGVAALLLSLQRRRGQRPDAFLVREAILRGASGCSFRPIPDCRRLLAGRLNIPGATSFLLRSLPNMGQPVQEPVPSVAPSDVEPSFSPAPAVEAPRVVQRMTAPALTAPILQPEKSAAPSPGRSCGCGGTNAPQMVYALGQLSYDLVSEARCDSLAQKMAGLSGGAPHRGLAFDHREMLSHFDKNPWDAASVEWTLSQDGTPLYAVRPQGPFAAQAYERLREFMTEQEAGEIERVSIPGAVSGRTRLLNGQAVPVLVPELRGMYSWTTAAMVRAVIGDVTGDGEPERRRAGLHNFLERVYHGVRNLGVMPQERAINFAATNAFEAGAIYMAALKERMELDTINVVRSPVCRPESDCWDVELYFFYPERQVQTVRKVYRFTVDVSDVVPVTVGPVRTWFAR